MTDFGGNHKGHPPPLLQQRCGSDQERRPGRRQRRKIHAERTTKVQGADADITIESLVANERWGAGRAVKALGCLLRVCEEVADVYGGVWSAPERHCGRLLVMLDPDAVRVVRQESAVTGRRPLKFASRETVARRSGARLCYR